MPFLNHKGQPPRPEIGISLCYLFVVGPPLLEKRRGNLISLISVVLRSFYWISFVYLEFNFVTFVVNGFLSG
jgi:hypothetical protein